MKTMTEQQAMTAAAVVIAASKTRLKLDVVNDWGTHQVRVLKGKRIVWEAVVTYCKA